MQPKEALEKIRKDLLPIAIEKLAASLNDMEGTDLADIAFKILDRAGIVAPKEGPSELEVGAKIATASIAAAFGHLAQTFGVRADIPATENVKTIKPQDSKAYDLVKRLNKEADDGT